MAAPAEKTHQVDAAAVPCGQRQVCAFILLCCVISSYITLYFSVYWMQTMHMRTCMQVLQRIPYLPYPNMNIRCEHHTQQCRSILFHFLDHATWVLQGSGCLLVGGLCTEDPKNSSGCHQTQNLLVRNSSSVHMFESSGIILSCAAVAHHPCTICTLTGAELYCTLVNCHKTPVC